MNHYETEAYLKSFLIFFISLISISSFALYLYDNEQNQVYQERLLTQMDAYSYSLHDKRFLYQIVPIQKDMELHELIISNSEVYALFPNQKDMGNSCIKVNYPYSSYTHAKKEHSRKILLIFTVIFFVLLFLAFFFAHFALFPLRKALMIMEDFLKDIIHDLNTPISSIILNGQLLKRKYSDQEIERIIISGKTITGLYKNLEVLYRDLPITKEEINLKPFFQERLSYFQVLYCDLNFDLKGEGEVYIYYNKDIFTRIIDNLLSNACKYNIHNGKVIVRFDADLITIQDSGVGIQDTEKVFKRFYRESDRGLGIGLHIVDTLSKKIGLHVSIQSTLAEGTTVYLRPKKY